LINLKRSGQPGLSWIFSLAFAAMLAAMVAAAPHRAAAQQTTPSASSPAPADATETTPDDEQKQDNVFRHAPVVQSIGRKLGLSVETTARVFEFLNFLIIVVAIVVPIVKIVPRMLRQRAETLNQDIKTARAASDDAKARLSAVESKLAGLGEEIQKFRDQIEHDSLEDEKRIKAGIEEESARIITSAEQEITVAAAQARRALRHFATDLALDQAADQVTKRLASSPETDRALIAEFVGDAQENGARGGAR
jgi:F-type H+-transporting ATPase subunit b